MNYILKVKKSVVGIKRKFEFLSFISFISYWGFIFLIEKILY